MSDEQRYTMEEAKLKLAKEECDRFGHSFDVVVEMGSADPTRIFCSRCGRGWTVVTKANGR
jgi:ribosomal protein S27AE